MFAQLFGAAKRVISRTPSYQGRSSEARDEVPEVPTSDPAPTQSSDNEDTAYEVTMVTTRRGTETPGMAATPASSAKKTVGKRELEALDTPTQAKRQRKTTVEFTRTLRSTPRKGGDAQESAEEAIDDAAGATPRPDKSSPLAIHRRSSPKVVVEPASPAKDDAPAQDGFHTPEPASSEAAFVTPFTSKKALEGSPTPKAAQSATPAAARKARGRPRKTQKDQVPEEIPSPTQESSAASPTAAAPKAHVRFGSEEPTMNAKGHTRYEAPAPAPAPTPAVDEDVDSDSDSDEAPEMVSTSAAASKAAAAQADTSRALAAQSEKELKKRLAREQRIAAEQAAKRERDALKAQKAAARAKKAARLSSVAELDEDATPMQIDRTSLPSLLPDSLLANLGDVRPPTPPPEARGRTEEELRREKLNRHIKFLEQSSKAPKDKRVGKHHVAVLGQQNRVLPPKVSKNTKGVREAWLKGRHGQQVKGKPRIGKTHRAKFGGGGFLREDD
ncbi:hypothetical protein E8E11_002348 [Didymella keratinophila]|nr:hypothetical protein E8E11_002348 [Didymella keratinophila]